MADQVIRNRQIEEISSQRNSKLDPLNQTCERQSKFGQLPCTQKTAQERVKKISELVGIDSPILILGDDDMVSIECVCQSKS